MQARHNIRVRGRVDEIKPSNIGQIFIGMFAVITIAMLIAFGMAATQPAKAEEARETNCPVDEVSYRVWYFNCSGHYFATALADKLERRLFNSPVEVEAMISNSTGGTTVVVRPLE